MAKLIPGAQMFDYVSDNHVPLAQELAFDLVQQAIFDFVEEHAVT